MKIILLLMLLALSFTANGADTEADCRARLKQLGGAVKAYRVLHDKSPAKLSELYIEGLAENLSDFVCPASGANTTAASEIDAKSDYTLLPLADAKDMLIREKVSRHGGDTVLVVFTDGSIQALPNKGAGAAPTAPAITNLTTPPTRIEQPQVVTSPTPPTTPPVARREPEIQTSDPAPPNDNHGLVIAKKQEGGIELRQGLKEMPGDVGIGFGFDGKGRLVVASVDARGLGKMLGIRVGDLVTEIEDKPAPKRAEGAISLAELAKLAGTLPGDDLILSLRQSDGSETSIALPTPDGLPPTVQLIPPGMVVTPQRPIPNAPALGGVRLVAHAGAVLRDNREGNNGAVVSEVSRNSPAEAAGLKAGDLIVAFDGDPIENSRQFGEAVAKKAPGDRVNLLVNRGGRNFKVTLTLGGRPFAAQPTG